MKPTNPSRSAIATAKPVKEVSVVASLLERDRAGVLELSAVVGQTAVPSQPAKPDDDLIGPSWLESGD